MWWTHRKVLFCIGLQGFSLICIWRPCGDSNPETLTPEDSKLVTKKSQSSYEKTESEPFAADETTAKLPTNNLGCFDNDFYARGMHDSDLGIVVMAWAKLPEAVRVGIVATVRALARKTDEI
jgi:hypothetical protein